MNELKLLLVQTSIAFKDPIPDAALDMYVAILSEYPVADVRRALKLLLTSSPYPKTPTIGAIVQAMAPLPIDVARETAGKVMLALRKHGPYKVTEAREFIGPLGWAAVEAIGGWNIICQISEDDVPNYNAQIRDLCLALQRNEAARPKASPLPSVALPEKVTAMLESRSAVMQDIIPSGEDE